MSYGTPKKIRILEGIRQGKIGGGESYLLSLVENLDRERYEPVVLSFTEGPMVERLTRLGIRTHVIHTETPFDVRVWKKVRRLMREEKIDLVHAHGTRAASNMFWAARKNQLPLVYTCHAWSFHPDQSPLVHRFRVMSERYLTQQTRVNICGCQANRDTGRKLLGNFDAVVINNSVDNRRFNPYGTYRRLRSEIGLNEDHLVFASIARFTLQKQPLKLIEAFAPVAKAIPHARLLMVGDGEQKEEAIRLIARLGLEDRIVLLPFRQDVPELLANIDIFVLPSLWEAFPISLLEAMSMGKAVIATHVDGTPEMVEHEFNGLLIGVKDLVGELSATMLRLGQDEALRKKLEQNSIKSIYNRYTVDILARKNEEVYQQVMHNETI